MQPTGLRRHSRKGWQIEFACTRCGMPGVNRAAPDDTDALIALMAGAEPL